MNPDEEVKGNAEKVLTGIKGLFELEERYPRGTELMEDEDWDTAIEEFKYLASTDKTSAKACGNLGFSLYTYTIYYACGS